MLFLPPGSAKSTYASDLFPAWRLAQQPNYRIIAASNTADLATSFSRRVRNRVRGHGATLGYGLEREAEDLWSTTTGGEYLAAGVTASIAGFRADLGLIDDPMRSREEADSITRRNRVWDWYNDDFTTRLKPGAAEVLIGTRWHEDDLFGRILRHQPDQWRVLKIPAIADSEDDPLGRKIGQYLWADDEYGYAQDLAEKKARSLPRTWASLYQQSPRTEGGEILKGEWWQPWTAPPPSPDYILISLDTAYTAKDQNDPTACTVWWVAAGDDERSVALMRYAWAKRLEFPELIEEVEATISHFAIPHVPLRVLVENKATGLSVVQELRRRLPDLSIWEVQPRGDKVARAYAVQSLFEAGRVFHLANEDGTIKPWAQSVIDECMIAGTQILTADGLKAIEDISPGDLVMTHMGRFRPVLRTSSRIATGVFTLEAKTLDPMTLTANHPLYAVRVDSNRQISAPEWVPASDIHARSWKKVTREGREFVEASGAPHHAATLPVPLRETSLDEIDLREWARVSAGKAHEILDDGDAIRSTHLRSKWMRWRQPLDYRFGRFVGLFVAEGYTRRSQTVWALNAHTERHLIDEILSFIDERLGCSGNYRVQGNCASVYANLPLMHDFFAEFGCPAQNKTLPRWVWDAPDDFLSGLISGYSEGDGYTAGAVVTCSTVSRSLAWQVRLLCLRLGFQASVRCERDAGTGIIDGRTVSLCSTYSVSWRTVRQNNGAALQGDGLVGYSVMRASAADTEVEVFNMDVFEDHSYVTTGGTVHNCAAFPRGMHDDRVDSVTMALRHVRDSGAVLMPEDDPPPMSLSRAMRSGKRLYGAVGVRQA